MTKKRILVVEDETIIALDEQQILWELGYEPIDFARSGEEAIGRAGRFRPDLVLMDIVLDGQMDGTEAALIIRDRYEIPVMFVTACGIKQNQDVSPPEGFGYVVKPYTKQELQSEIERLLS